MTWFAVYRIADGALMSVGTVVADDATLAAKGFAKLDLGASRPEGVWNPASLAFDPPPPAPRTLTPSTFKQRFTLAERTAIRAAGATDMVIADYLDILATARDVDLNDANVVAGLDYMVGQALITASRKDEILNG